MNSLPRTDPPFAEGTQPNSGGSDPIDVRTKLTVGEQDTRTLVGTTAETGTPGEAVNIGQKIGKYEIRAQLGAGGMGAVYLAFDPLIEREVALKVLSPDLSSSSTALQRFLGEARAIGRLNNPHVVSIYDIDQWNGQYYLVMELISGGSVADRVDAGRVPWEEACRMIAQAARGLAAAHEAGMIHRDIKPENLMLTKDGTVKVVDFGLSKLLDASNNPHDAVTKAGQILGTPQYMSPEQFEAEEIDSRTDIYSLGATLFRLLTARFPYHDCHSIVQVMTAHMTKPPPAPTEFEPSTPAECNRIVARAMAKNPADRYQTCLQLATELEALTNRPSASTTVASTASVVVDRPLQSAVIVEPSKLQGAVLRDAFSRAGLPTVQVVSSVEAAREAVVNDTPDLFITAMQLPDGRGLDLLRDLSQQPRFHQTTVVLNSSDSTIEELTADNRAAGLVLAPKKVRPEDILRVAHATGPGVVTSGPLAQPIDPACLRLQIVLESGRLPDVLVTLIRELNLLDIEVTAGTGAITPTTPPPDLILVLLPTSESTQNGKFSSAIQQFAESGPMAVAVQLQEGQLILGAVCRNSVFAICHRVLDAARLICLLQSCRS